MIGGRNGYFDRWFHFVIERLPRLELQLIANDLEPRVIDRPSMRIARIGINDAHVANDRSRGVFSHSGIAQRDRRWHLIDVANVDREQLVVRQACSRLIGGRKGHFDRRFHFVIERLPRLELQLIANDLETRIVYRPSMRVARVGINNCHVANDRSGELFSATVALLRDRLVATSLTLLTLIVKARCTPSLLLLDRWP